MMPFVEHPLTEEEMLGLEAKTASTSKILGSIAVKALASIAILGLGAYVLFK